MKTQKVIISVVGGVASLVKAPKGIRVEFRDYDCTDCYKRKSKKHYHAYTEVLK